MTIDYLIKFLENNSIENCIELTEDEDNIYLNGKNINGYCQKNFEYLRGPLNLIIFGINIELNFYGIENHDYIIDKNIQDRKSIKINLNDIKNNLNDLPDSRILEAFGLNKAYLKQYNNWSFFILNSKGLIDIYDNENIEKIIKSINFIEQYYNE